jgi:hypothetical protein
MISACALISLASTPVAARSTAEILLGKPQEHARVSFFDAPHELLGHLRGHALQGLLLCRAALALDTGVEAAGADRIVGHDDLVT